MLKLGALARLSLHLSKYYIVGNHMSRLNYIKGKLTQFNIDLCFTTTHSVSLLRPIAYFTFADLQQRHTKF